MPDTKVTYVAFNYVGDFNKALMCHEQIQDTVDIIKSYFITIKYHI